MSVSRKLFVPTREQKEAAHPLKSVWVSANAGSGKTHVLVDRLIRLLLAGADPSSVLSITFTQAAAGEMATRVFQRLGGWAILDDVDLRAQLVALGVDPVDESVVARARQLFARALETPGGLKVQTIHAFCQSLLHLFPVEAGIAPGFAVLEESEALHEQQEVWLSTLELMRQDPGSSLASSFERIESCFNSTQLQADLGQLISQPTPLLYALSEAPDYSTARGHAFLAFGLDPSQEASAVQKKVGGIDQSELHYLIAAFADTKPYGKQMHISILLDRIVKETNPSLMLDIMRDALFTTKQKPYVTFLSADTRKKHPHAAARLDTMHQALVGFVQEHDAYERATLSADLLHIGAHVLARYRARKQQRGAFDFNDLIMRTAEMLRRTSAAQWVLNKLDSGIEHILVDEAQDTSAAQWSIILALADEFFAGEGRPRKSRRTLFVVGDQKQSIYSFQGADAALFAQVHDDVAAKATASVEFADVRLGLSYRSVGDILNIVDAVFPPEDLRSLGITALHAGGEAHEPKRLGERGVFELWPVLSPRDEPDPLPWDAPVDAISPASPSQRLAREIARLVKSWIGRRTIAATGKPVDPGDILILLKRRSPVFSLLIAALRQAGVPVAGADRLTLNESLAVQDLLALAQFILLPDDDYSLACVLKSPLLEQPFDDVALFEVGHKRQGTLWSAIKHSQHLGAIAAASKLTELQNLADVAPPFEFFATVLNQRRKAMAARLGPESVDATHAFLDLALDYQTTHTASLAGFVAWFASGEVNIRREMDKPLGEVRIMTVHGAKGLEAPIVIIPEATDSENPRKSGYLLSDGGVPLVTTGKLVDNTVLETLKNERRLREREEYMRLLYVAMTRARDELYVFGTRGKSRFAEASWYGSIEQALEKPIADARKVEVAFDGETHEVLRIGVDPQWRHDDHISTSTTPSDTASLMPEWSRIPERLRFAAMITPVPLMAEHSDTNEAVERGIALHSLLQHLADISEAERVSAAAALAQKLRLTPQDSEQVLAILARDELAPFYGPNSAGEVAIAHRRDDTMTEPMRIDRLVVTTQDVLVLDYKSGRGPSGPLAPYHPYLRQMVRYSDALAEAYPGRNIRPAILWIDSGRLDWISATELSRARELLL